MNIPQRVELKKDGAPGFGGLSSIFLAEEQYFGGSVPVIGVHSNGYKVELPSGYILEITKKDILTA